MKNINVIIIQPHSDDALLSCKEILDFAKQTDSLSNVTIATFDSDLKRHGEDQMLFENEYKEVNLLNVGLEFGLENISQNLSHKEYWKKNIKLESFEDVCDTFNISSDMLSSYILEMKRFIKMMMKTTDGNCVFLVPAGIGNPHHLKIRTAFECCAILEAPYLLYKDLPHANKKRNKAQLDLFNSLETAPDIIESGFVRKEDFHKEKSDFFMKYYKSQSSFAFFESSFFRKTTVEEVYKMPSLL